MKITIKKGPVSLEMTIDAQDIISKIQEFIFQHIPIAPEVQVLNIIQEGSIVRLI